MNLKIHHVALTVRDMDESIAWYEKNLSAKVITRYQKHGHEIAQIKCGEAWLELFSGDTPLPEYRNILHDDIRVIGTKHLALQTDDLESLTKKLKENGVEFATETDTAGFGGRYVFIKDPNGILIELYQG